MIKKKILDPDRVRRINGGFSFIPHKFLRDGFLDALRPQEILLYFFLVLASDRNGLSYYSYDRICKFLKITVDEYIEARDSLIKTDLIAFDGSLFQVLDLPKESAPKKHRQNHGRLKIENLIQQSIREI